MTNFLVEEHEKREIYMKDYFAGTLLNYTLKCENLNIEKHMQNSQSNLSKKKVNQDSEKLIYLKQPILMKNVSYLQDDPNIFNLPHEPLLRSSVMISSFDGRLIYLFFVDSNLVFHAIDATLYSSDRIDKLYSVPLDRKYVNSTCQDLIYIVHTGNFDNLYLFCESVNYDQQSYEEKKVQVHVIIQSPMEGIPKIKYIMYDQQVFMHNHPAGIRYLGFQFVMSDKPMFLGIKPSIYYPSEFIQYLDDPVIFIIDWFKIKSELFNDPAIEAVYIQNQSEYYQISQRVAFTFSLRRKYLLDMQVLQQQSKVIVFIFKDMILNCHYNESIYQPDKPPYSLLECADEVSQVVEHPNPLSLFQHPADKNFYHVATSYPPSILEVDISDKYNFINYKIYTAVNDKSTHIGTSTLTANLNCILHLMKDIETGQSFIRFYDRKANRFEVSKYDYFIEKSWPTTYLGFQNQFINYLWVRDEQKIYSLSFYEWRIILDGRDSSLVTIYDDDIFSCNLTLSNSRIREDVYFNVTFIDKYNHTVLGKNLLRANTSNDLDAFYSCGDEEFIFSTTNMFIGPDIKINFSEYDQNCTDGSCFFVPENQYSYIYSNIIIEGIECNNNQIFPANKDAANGDLAYPILVCIQVRQQQIASYIINEELQTLNLTQVIKFPFQEFISFNYDLDDRALIFLSNTHEKWLSGIEVHFLYVENTAVIWKKSQKNPISGMEYFFDKLLDIYYDDIINKGCILFDKTSENSQMLIVFEIDYQKVELLIIAIETDINRYSSHYTLRTIVSSNIIFTIKSDDLISMLYYSETGFGIRLRWLRDIKPNVDSKDSVLDVDIIDDNYLVIYYTSSKIEVYQIFNEIYTTFTMRLPKYKNYENFTFNYQKDFGKIVVRTNIDGFLAILLYGQDDQNPTVTKHKLFVYCIFCTSQHDSIAYIMDVTYILDKQKQFQIQMYSDGDRYRIAVMSETNLIISGLSLYNNLMINYGEGYYQLLENCSQAIDLQDWEIENRKENAIKLADFQLTSYSSFSKQTSAFNDINLKVYTENQGLIVDPQVKGKNYIEVYYEKQSNKTMNSTLLVQEYFTGFSIFYDFDCNYFDKNMVSQKCNSALNIETMSLPFVFFIEFATQNRKVIQTFILDSYFFMIDSAFDWHLLKFPDNSKSLDLEAENKPLDVVATGQTQIQFGCIIDGYLNINEFHREEDKIQYVAMYQCNDPLTKYVKLSKITIYIRQKYIEQKDYIDIQHLIGNLQYPYQIISIELGFIYAFDLTRDVFQTCILISSDIPGSFTNIISKVDVSIDFKFQSFSAREYKWISSLTELKNTFKTTQIISIQVSRLLIIVDQDTGVYFYDLQSLTKIFEINIKDHDDFFAQMLYQYGPLKVFACVEELKYNLHIITNYGIYIFTFRQDLRNDTSYFSDSQYKFEIIKKHVLRIPIDLFNSKIAINQYGYAFLVQKTTENNVSKIYLALVSFYSKITQKILKVIFVGDNLNCHSLNENDKFSSHSEDQIAVSIICESEIFVYRIFIRPHVEVDFSSFGQHAFSFENQNLTNGPFSYNQFNVTIFAQNPFSQYDDIKSVKVVYHYMENIDQGRTEFYLISFGLIIVIAILIVFLNHGPLQRKRQGSIIKENMNANEIKSLKSSVGYVNGYQLNLKNKDSRLIVNSIRDSKTIRLSKDINEILLKEQDTVKNNQEQQRLRETALTFNNHKTINHLSENIFGVSKEQNDLNSNSDKNFSGMFLSQNLKSNQSNSQNKSQASLDLSNSLTKSRNTQQQNRQQSHYSINSSQHSNLSDDDQESIQEFIDSQQQEKPHKFSLKNLVKSKNKHDQKKLLQGYRNLSFQQKSIEIKNKRKILSQEQQEQEMDIIVNESDQIQ